jgi:polyhydroxyalkanoate synthesis repressor PhaR
MSEYREIRKYANRRLYDLECSRYINRDDLRELITGGHQIRVIDDVSGGDITRSLLLQLLAEQELGGQPALSNAVLTELIRFCNHPMQALLGSYLQQSIEKFVGQRQKLQGQVQKVLDGIPGAGISDIAGIRLDDWLSAQRQFLEATLGKKRRRRPRYSGKNLDSRRSAVRPK